MIFFWGIMVSVPDGWARSDALLSAWRVGVLSFASPKESSQRKGDPSVGAGQARFLALLGRPGGWLNSPAAQTTPADCPRPACVAQRLSRGPKAFRLNRFGQKWHCYGQPEKKPKNEIHSLIVDALPGPLEGAEQRRSAGGPRLALSEPQASLASRPAFRVAQGTGAAGTDRGSPSFCLLFLGEARKSKTPRKGGTPRQLRRIHTP